MQRTDPTQLLSEAELAVAKRLASGDILAKDEAEAIYYRHVAAFVDGGRRCVAMGFLSEFFNDCPDLVLRASYRKRLLA